MRKTKIVCTLGPATDREGVLREMMLAGMNVARFNFSHGTHPEHKVRLDAVKALREELDLPVAAMLDTKGPEVRLRNFKNGSVELTAGQEFTLTTDEEVEGDETRCAISYAALPQDVTVGDTILLDDGLVRLTVLETTSKTIRCRVENDGTMKNHKGVNVPGVSLSMPYKMCIRDRAGTVTAASGVWRTPPARRRCCGGRVSALSASSPAPIRSWTVPAGSTARRWSAFPPPDGWPTLSAACCAPS